MILNFFTQQVGQQLVQQQVLLTEADKLGITATDDDVVKFLHRANSARSSFPRAVYIGDDQYQDFVVNRAQHVGGPSLKTRSSKQIVIHRLQRADHGAASR